MNAPVLPPSIELFVINDFVPRHPTILNEHRLRWSLRNRATNGLAEAGAVFEAQSGELVIHEPSYLKWFLGLTGRGKPRASAKRRKPI